ncbi:hypothetical protein U1Q18_051579 [Sarracenia purpurea var. burkii]
MSFFFLPEFIHSLGGADVVVERDYSAAASKIKGLVAYPAREDQASVSAAIGRVGSHRWRGCGPLPELNRAMAQLFDIGITLTAAIKADTAAARGAPLRPPNASDLLSNNCASWPQPWRMPWPASRCWSTMSTGRASCLLRGRCCISWTSAALIVAGARRSCRPRTSRTRATPLQWRSPTKTKCRRLPYSCKTPRLCASTGRAPILCHAPTAIRHPWRRCAHASRHCCSPPHTSSAQTYSGHLPAPAVPATGAVIESARRSLQSIDEQIAEVLAPQRSPELVRLLQENDALYAQIPDQYPPDVENRLVSAVLSDYMIPADLAAAVTEIEARRASVAALLANIERNETEIRAFEPAWVRGAAKNSQYLDLDGASGYWRHYVTTPRRWVQPQEALRATAQERAVLQDNAANFTERITRRYAEVGQMPVESRGNGERLGEEILLATSEAHWDAQLSQQSAAASSRTAPRGTIRLNKLFAEVADEYARQRRELAELRKSLAEDAQELRVRLNAELDATLGARLRRAYEEAVAHIRAGPYTVDAQGNPHPEPQRYKPGRCQRLWLVAAARGGRANRAAQRRQAPTAELRGTPQGSDADLPEGMAPPQFPPPPPEPLPREAPLVPVPLATTTTSAPAVVGRVLGGFGALLPLGVGDHPRGTMLKDEPMPAASPLPGLLFQSQNDNWSAYLDVCEQLDGGANAQLLRQYGRLAVLEFYAATGGVATSTGAAAAVDDMFSKLDADLHRGEPERTAATDRPR